MGNLEGGSNFRRFLSVIFLVIIIFMCIIDLRDAILGFIFGIFMYILIQVFGSWFGKFLLNLEFRSFMSSKKKRTKDCVLYGERFRRIYRGFFGVVNLGMMIAWISLCIVFLLLRLVLSILEFAETGLGQEAVSHIPQIAFMAIIAGMFLSPLIIPYWVINNSRIRIIDLKYGVIHQPGGSLKFLYNLLGVGNLAVFVYFTITAISLVGLIDGLILTLQAFLHIGVIVGVAGLIASLLLHTKSEVLKKTLNHYENLYEKVALKDEGFLNLLKSYLKENTKEKIENQK